MIIRELSNRLQKTCDYNGGQKKPAIKNPLGKKEQEIWVRTMARAPAVGNLSYGGFTKIRQPIVQ